LGAGSLKRNNESTAYLPDAHGPQAVMRMPGTNVRPGDRPTVDSAEGLFLELNTARLTRLHMVYLTFSYLQLYATLERLEGSQRGSSFELAACGIRRIHLLVQMVLHHVKWLTLRIVFDRSLGVADLDSDNGNFVGLVVVDGESSG